MATYEHVDIMVCTDCIMYLANGDLPSGGRGTVADDARVVLGEGILALGGYGVHAGDSDRVEEFSREWCDMCADQHHGKRHHAVMWREIVDRADCIESEGM